MGHRRYRQPRDVAHCPRGRFRCGCPPPLLLEEASRGPLAGAGFGRRRAFGVRYSSSSSVRPYDGRNSAMKSATSGISAAMASSVSRVLRGRGKLLVARMRLVHTFDERADLVRGLNQTRLVIVATPEHLFVHGPQVVWQRVEQPLLRGLLHLGVCRANLGVEVLHGRGHVARNDLGRIVIHAISAARSALRSRPCRTLPITHSACAIMATSSECSARFSGAELRMSAHRSMYLRRESRAKKWCSGHESFLESLRPFYPSRWTEFGIRLSQTRMLPFAQTPV